MPLVIRHRQSGLTMIELLVTVVILLVGLLGLAGLQSRLQQSEVESYQRAQALILLNDMSNRIMANRNAAADYVTTAVGAGAACPAAGSTRSSQDINAWCQALRGAAETIGTSEVGAMIGGRGCVEDLGSNTYMVTVAWQGIIPLQAPTASVSCGQNTYNDTAACANDLCRRTVTTLVRIGNLEP